MALASIVAWASIASAVLRIQPPISASTVASASSQCVASALILTSAYSSGRRFSVVGDGCDGRLCSIVGDGCDGSLCSIAINSTKN